MSPTGREAHLSRPVVDRATRVALLRIILLHPLLDHRADLCGVGPPGRRLVVALDPGPAREIVLVRHVEP